jgi:hypothetical protein
MNSQWHSHRVFALKFNLLIPFRPLDGLHEDITVLAIGQTCNRSFDLYGGSSRCESHLVQIDPSLVSSEEGKLELSLQYSC